jgi:hypothetical protein
MMHALRLALLAGLVSAPVLAGPNDTPDANDIPDASVGVGGADQSSQETADTSKACTRDSDCDHGALCVNQLCTRGTTRNATFLGCTAAPGPLVVAALGLTLLLRRRP